MKKEDGKSYIFDRPAAQAPASTSQVSSRSVICIIALLPGDTTMDVSPILTDTAIGTHGSKP